jgi:uncharacterized protein (DUF2267 family)
MQYHEFIGQVQNQARLPTQGEAARAICATLETLGEHLSEGEAMNLAAQLPPGIGDYLRLARKNEQRFSLDEFFERVAEREGAGVDLPQSVYNTRAVIHVLQDAVTPGLLHKMRAQLPDDYNPLFEAGMEGQLNRNN